MAGALRNKPCSMRPGGQSVAGVPHAAFHHERAQTRVHSPCKHRANAPRAPTTHTHNAPRTTHRAVWATRRDPRSEARGCDTLGGLSRIPGTLKWYHRGVFWSQATWCCAHVPRGWLSKNMLVVSALRTALRPGVLFGAATPKDTSEDERDAANNTGSNLNVKHHVGLVGTPVHSGNFERIMAGATRPPWGT